MKKIAICVSLLFILSIPKIYAETINACVSRNGRMYLISPEFRRQECHTNDTPLSFNKEGVPGPMGPQGPQGLQGPQGFPGATLNVIDGNGQNLGLFVSASSDLSWIKVFLSSVELTIQFNQRRSEGLPEGSASVTQQVSRLFYLQQNCQGYAYSSSAGNPGSGVFLGQRLFRNTIDSVDVVALSTLDGSDVCNNESIYAGDLYRVEEVVLPFTFPLTWPLSVIETP